MGRPPQACQGDIPAEDLFVPVAVNVQNAAIETIEINRLKKLLQSSVA